MEIKALLFAVIVILIAYWIGFVFLNPLVVLGLSLLLTLIVVKKASLPIEKIPIETILSALIVMVICAVPLLLIHPFYMGSNDALHTINHRTLEMAGSIPQTYDPYSSVSFSYQIGFALLSKTLSNPLFFLEDYQVIWLLGLVFVGIETILFYLVSKELLGSRQAGVWASILFIGTKTVYINFFFGMMPRILASCLILAFLYLHKKKNIARYLIFPALIMVHAGYFVNLILLLSVYLLFNPSELKPIIKVIPFGLLAIPAFVQNYSVYLKNMLFERIASVSSSVSLIQLPSFTLGYLLNLGWTPLVLFVLAIGLSIKKHSFSREKKFALTVFLLGSIIYFVAFVFGITVENVYPWLYSFGAILFVAICLTELKLSKRKQKIVQVVLVLFLLIGFCGSSYLRDRMLGSKISLEEARFAMEFKEFDSELKTVLFLGVGSAKVSELSNKIPFNVKEGWFLPLDYRLMTLDNAYFEEMSKGKLKRELFESKCVECVSSFEVNYVVVNVQEFPKLNSIPVLVVGNIFVYKKESLE